MKAQADLAGIEIEKTVDATKEKISAETASELLGKASLIHVVKGNKTLEISPENRDGILASAIGPSGNLRAPAIRIGDEYFIGHNPWLYEKIRMRLE